MTMGGSVLSARFARKVPVEETQHTFMAACLVAGLVAAGLLLPAALFDLVFDTDFLGIVSQAVLAAFALVLIVVVWTAPKQK